jgi:hypothetical protein
MAVSIAVPSDLASGQNRFVMGPFRCVIVDVTFDGSYDSLGEPLVASTLGLHKIVGVQEIGQSAAAGAHAEGRFQIDYNYASGLLRAYGTGQTNAAGAGTGTTPSAHMTAAGAQMNNYVIRLLVWGLGS